MREFYRSIGVSKQGMASIIGKAKRMRREGKFPVAEFKEVKIMDTVNTLSGCDVIELTWENGRLIRFGQVEQLLEFLKKAA
jgi:hypothetical protein